MPDPRKPLYCTFGNHMHWVDMQWLWGYGVLPGCVKDMLHLCRETGARGNVNFDGIGYEKMAAECPEALAELREAVQKGIVEPVGCSYGQPYGLFHGGESNIRQFTHGVRTVRRLLGVHPRAFWEEEFYFFPQLPQILAQCGFTGACLFFQWTWHTPEVPKEPCSLILWEGIDGTRLPTLPRNTLNVHQWPEDFDGLLEQGLIRELDRPAIVQWLELMPSKDWMCRSELLLPRLKALMADDRFEVRARTVSQMIDELRAGGDPPTRRYTLDDVWHGMTLGKNADRHPRTSRNVEQRILGAESMAAFTALFGRPYPRWDVYPTWELDEAWRDLLAAQHHDNHECEGLCGDIGALGFRRADELAGLVAERTLGTHASRLKVQGHCDLVFNQCGWARDMIIAGHDQDLQLAENVPPFGTAATVGGGRVRPLEKSRAMTDKKSVELTRGKFRVVIDRKAGLVAQVFSPEFPQGAIASGHPFGRVFRGMGSTGEFELPAATQVEIRSMQDGTPVVRARHTWRDGATVAVDFYIALAATPSLHATFHIEDPGEMLPGFSGSFQTEIAPADSAASIFADSAFAIETVRAPGEYKRKYPEGDWMTSKQWFETVRRPFTALSLVDFASGQDGPGQLYVHEGSQQFLAGDGFVRHVLSVSDPWDEVHADPRGSVHMRLIPHGPISNAARVQLAAELNSFDFAACAHGSEWEEDPSPPPWFGALEVCNAPNVLAHAFLRESAKSGEHLPEWAGHRMTKESGGACDHPYVVRLVEWDGRPAEVVLKLPGKVAMAAKTNLLGEVPADGGWLNVEHPVAAPEWATGAQFDGKPITWSQIRFAMRAHEIATIMADLVMGRKEWRDLDAKRKVWATVHKEKKGRDEETQRRSGGLPG